MVLGEYFVIIILNIFKSFHLKDLHFIDFHFSSHIKEKSDALFARCFYFTYLAISSAALNISFEPSITVVFASYAREAEIKSTISFTMFTFGIST